MSRLLLAVLISWAVLPVEVHAGHWSYEAGKMGPQNWGNIDSHFAACAVGGNQSPIDVTNAIPAELPALALAYAGQATEILNNGHAVQLNFTGKNELRSNGKAYALLQAHFHTPSEHTLGGKAYPGEIHFVHKAPDGELAVVGFFIEPGDDNPAFAFLGNTLPKGGASAMALAGKPAAGALLAASDNYFRYVGSLTTPPCTEGVQWHVMKTPIRLSEKQISELAAQFKTGTARPVQPLKTRFLLQKK